MIFLCFISRGPHFQRTPATMTGKRIYAEPDVLQRG
jgi:hypothetical protein